MNYKVLKKFNQLVDNYLQDRLDELSYSMNSKELDRAGYFRVNVQGLIGELLEHTDLDGEQLSHIVFEHVTWDSDI